MNRFYERLLAEKQELDSRIDRLTNFLESESIYAIDQRHTALLNVQVNIMKAYSQVLLERIAITEVAAEENVNN